MPNAKTKRNKAAVAQPLQPGKTKNRRTRRNRKNRRNPLVKTVGRRLPASTHDGATFLRAALDPFSDQLLRSVGVPDSYAGNTLKHTNTMEITCTPVGGEITFVILPSVSSPILPLVGNFLNIVVPQIDATTNAPDGTTVLGTLDSVGFTGENWGAIPWPTWASAYGSSGSSIAGGNPAFGPYDYKSCRIVSMGLEWRYTGTSLSDSGVCTAAIVDAYNIPGQVDYVAPATPNNPVSTDVKFIQRGDVTTLTSISQGVLSNQPGYVQQTMHSSEGAGGMIVLIPAEEGYCMVPFNTSTCFVDASSATSGFNSASGVNIGSIGTYSITNAASPKSAFSPMSPWQNLRPVGVTLTGLPTTGGAIVLRIKQRVEATVAPVSAFAQFTDKSPSEDQLALTMVANVAKTLPVMVPVTMNAFGDWWRRIMGVIGNVGSIVGGIGLPIVSPVAGAVGALADVLGAL